MKKAIGYVRVSTNQQNYERQCYLITEHCKVYDYNLIKIIGDKESGTHSQRKGYIEIQQLTNEDADIVLMTEISRLSREEDIVEPLYIINSLIKNNISISFLENSIYAEKTLDGGKPLNAIQVIRLSIELDAASKENKKISQRMQTGRKFMFSRYPNICLGKVPFGYKKEDNPDYEIHKTPKTILVRSEDAKYITMMFNWSVEGKTINNIMYKLKALGIDMNISTIAHILHNPIYKGVWSYLEIVREGDAIVNADVWDKAQLALKNNVGSRRGNVNFHLLKGIIKCGECGHNMTITDRRNKLFYRCITQINTTLYKYCKCGTLNSSLANMAVWNAIKSNANSSDFITFTNEEVKRIEAQIKEKEEDIVTKTDELNNLKQNMDALVKRMAKVTNDNLFASLQDQYIEMDKESKQLSKSIEDLKQNIITYSETRLQIQKKATNEELENMTDDGKAPIIKRYVQEVTYYSEEKNRGFLVIDFKNGLQMIYMILSRKQTIIVQLPSAFAFDREQRKVIVTSMDRPTDTNKFSFGTHINLYNTYEIENNYPDLMVQNDINRKPSFE